MLARDLVPEQFHSLRMLRLFLPVVNELGAAIRWTALLPVGAELTASTNFYELWALYSADHPATVTPSPALGSLDPLTAHSLRELLTTQLGPAQLLSTRSWAGYSRSSAPGTRTSMVNGQEYAHETLTIHEIIERGIKGNVPDFVIDPGMAFAWGTCPYPDSLFIAAAPELFRVLHQDPRLDVASVLAHRDVLPQTFEG